MRMLQPAQVWLLVGSTWFSTLCQIKKDVSNKNEPDQHLSQKEAVSDLQCGDGLVLVHQVRHDSIQGALPLAGSARAGAGVRPELAQLFVFRLVGVRQCDFTSRRGILAGEKYRVGHLLHGKVSDGAEGTSAGGAAGELGPAVGAYLRRNEHITIWVFLLMIRGFKSVIV